MNVFMAPIESVFSSDDGLAPFASVVTPRMSRTMLSYCTFFKRGICDVTGTPGMQTLGSGGTPPVPPTLPVVPAEVPLGAVVLVPWVVPAADAPPVPVTLPSGLVVLDPGPPVGGASLFDAPSPEHPVARAVRQANNVAEPVE